MKDNKRLKNVIICAAVSGVVLVLAVASIVTGAMKQEKEKESIVANVSVDRVNLREDNGQTQVSTANTEVEIQFDDCAILIGTQLKLTALVIPENTEQALVWSSADSSILEITGEGIATVKGAGTTVVTATVGTVSDSVVIEGIENVANGSKNQFPVYTGSVVVQGDGTGSNTSSGGSTAGNSDSSGSNTGSQGGSSGNGSTGNTSSGDTGSSGGSGNTSSGDIGSSGGSGNTSSGDTGSSGGSGNTSSGDTGSSGGSGNTSSGDTGSSGGSDSTSSGSTSTEVSGELSGLGFTQRYSNVYVCEDGNTYYGEIITQPNVTIIYIKLRSDAFDAKIQSVLSQLLPEEYGQVWNNYLSATTDRTFTVEGRKVRIVAAPNGGHSQIVIYN